jgi:hypothetical protein
MKKRRMEMYRRNSPIFLFLVVVLLSVTGCNAGLRVISGSGNVITESRQVSNFDSIELSGSGEVIVTQGAGESLTIETDDNVMEYIESEVENGTLKLRLVTGLQTGVNIQRYTRLVFYVGVDNLNGLSTSGSGKIESDEIETGRLDLSVSGSGTIQIAELFASELKAGISGSGGINLGGDVAVQDIGVSGSGNYQAGEMCSSSVKVSVSGSGNATVCATEELDASLSGSGNVNYHGSPEVSISDSGSGNIRHLDDD